MRETSQPSGLPGASWRVQVSTGAAGRVTATLACPSSTNCGRAIARVTGAGLG